MPGRHRVKTGMREDKESELRAELKYLVICWVCNICSDIVGVYFNPAYAGFPEPEQLAVLVLAAGVQRAERTEGFAGLSDTYGKAVYVVLLPTVGRYVADHGIVDALGGDMRLGPGLRPVGAGSPIP